jgi:hypothetical protein
MSNQSEEGSILCTPIGAKLWPSTSSRPTISTSANTTWRTAGTVWSVQNLRQLSLHGTKLFGSAETPLQELATPDGTSVWAGDGVHLTSPAYRVAARLLAAELERSGLGEAQRGQGWRVLSHHRRRRRPSRPSKRHRRCRSRSPLRCGCPDSFP